MAEASRRIGIGPKKKRRWRKVALEKNLNLMAVHSASTEAGLMRMIILQSQDIQVKDGLISELPGMVSMGTTFMMMLPLPLEDRLIFVPLLAYVVIPLYCLPLKKIDGRSLHNVLIVCFQRVVHEHWHLINMAKFIIARKHSTYPCKLVTVGLGDIADKSLKHHKTIQDGYIPM